MYQIIITIAHILCSLNFLLFEKAQSKSNNIFMIIGYYLLELSLIVFIMYIILDIYIYYKKT
jgi:hypothetical protein